MMDERLIGEVERHAVIYNRQKTNMFTGDKSANKELAWLKIAHTLGTDPDTCKKRWKYLRERYVQQKKTGDTPSYEHLSRPYLEKMRFLDNFIQPRKSYRNVGSSSLISSPTPSGVSTSAIHSNHHHLQQHHHQQNDNHQPHQHSNNISGLLDHAAVMLSSAVHHPQAVDTTTSTMSNDVAANSAANRLHVSHMMQQFQSHLNSTGGATITGPATAVGGNNTNTISGAPDQQISNDNLKLFDQFNSFVQQQQQQHSQFDVTSTAPFHMLGATATPSCPSVGGASSEAAVPVNNIVTMDSQNNGVDIDGIKNELTPQPSGSSASSLISQRTDPTTSSTMPVTSEAISLATRTQTTTGTSGNCRRQAKRQRMRRMLTASGDDERSDDYYDDDDDDTDDDDVLSSAHTDDEQLKMLRSPPAFSSEFLYPFYQHAAAAQQQQQQSQSQHRQQQQQKQQQQQQSAQPPVRNSEQLLGELVTSELLKMDKDRRKTAQKKILEILFFND